LLAPAGDRGRLGRQRGMNQRDSGSPEPSAWQLRVDLLTTHALLLVVRARGDESLRPEVHRYFADRYASLAHYQRRLGHTGRANALWAKSLRHWHWGGGDPIPPTAALAMPIPTFTRAIGSRFDEPPDAA
jgi:hypothetical protein